MRFLGPALPFLELNKLPVQSALSASIFTLEQARCLLEGHFSFLQSCLFFFFFFFLKQNFVLIPSFNSAVATCLFCKCCSISNSIDAKTVAAPCLFGIVDFRASWQSDMVLCRMRRVKKETLRQTQAGVIHGLTLVSSFVLPILHLVQHYECISLPKRLCSKLP